MSGEKKGDKVTVVLYAIGMILLLPFAIAFDLAKKSK